MYILWTRVEPGPEAGTDGPVVVSFTEYTAHRRRDIVRAAAVAQRLRMGWYAMSGAVGLVLHLEPLRSSGGSVSVWRSEEDLLRFVRLPLHLEIMRRYRELGTLRSAQWEMDRFVLREAVAQARRHLAAAHVRE